MTTFKAIKKATTRKARAILALLDRPGARLILLGREHAYLLAGREHIYICPAIFECLRAQSWISTPSQLASDVTECTITIEGHSMLIRWNNASGAGYQQLLFEEIEEFIKAEAQAEAQQKVLVPTAHQASLFEEPQESAQGIQEISSEQEPQASQITQERAAPVEQESSRQEEPEATEPNAETSEQAPQTSQTTQPPAVVSATKPQERDPSQIKTGDIIYSYDRALRVLKVNHVSLSCIDMNYETPSKHTIKFSDFEHRLYTRAEWASISQAERNKCISGKHPINAAPLYSWIRARVNGLLCSVQLLENTTFTAHLNIHPDALANGYKPLPSHCYVSYVHIDLIEEPATTQEALQEQPPTQEQPTELEPAAEPTQPTQLPAVGETPAEPAEAKDEPESDIEVICQSCKQDCWYLQTDLIGGILLCESCTEQQDSSTPEDDEQTNEPNQPQAEPEREEPTPAEPTQTHPDEPTHVQAYQEPAATAEEEHQDQQTGKAETHEEPEQEDSCQDQLEPSQEPEPDQQDAPESTLAMIIHRYEPDTALHWLEFPDKPDADTRTILKAEHWRFSGRVMQWRKAGLLTQLPELPGYRYEEAGTVDYAEDRAASYEQRADRATEEAASARQKADRIAGMIPFGQPIQIGHHSERRHRADIERIHSNTRKTIEALDKAEHLHDRAEASLAQQQYKQSPGAITRRLDQMRKDYRIYEHATSEEGQRRKGILEAEIARLESELEESGGIAADHISLQKGDLIVIHGHMVEVIRVNKKTITGYLASPVHNLFSKESGYTKCTKRNSGQHDRTRFSLRVYTVQEWAAVNEGRTQAEAYAIAEAHLKEMRRGQLKEDA